MTRTFDLNCAGTSTASATWALVGSTPTKMKICVETLLGDSGDNLDDLPDHQLHSTKR